MTGEIWRSSFQAAVETVYGTPVATATRKLYYDIGSSLKPDAPSTEHHFATGRRANVMARTNGAQQPSGSVSLPLSPSECLELFDMAFGAPVITTPATGTNTRLATYKPGSVLPVSGTLQWDDGAHAWRMAGTYVNTLTFQGSAGGDNMVSAELFGKALVPLALAGTPVDRIPDFYEGWETKIYLETIGGTPGTTLISNTLNNWNVQFSNQLGRKHTADNVNAMNKAVAGEIGLTATLTFEADQAISLTEFNHWLNDDVAGRLVRLEFGQNDTIEAALKSFVTVDLPGKWTGTDLGQTDEGTRVYQFDYGYLYDSVLGDGIQVRAQSLRQAAWLAA